MNKLETPAASDGIHAGTPAGAVTKVDRKLLAGNTAINLAGQLTPLVAAVLCMPYIIRGLGPDRFGVLGIVWIVYGYFNLFDLGLGRATTKFLAEFLARGRGYEIPSLVWTALGFQVLLGVVGSLALVPLMPLLAERILKVPPALRAETLSTLLLLLATLPLVLVTNQLRAVLEGCQRFDLSNLVRIPASSLVFVIPAAAIPFGLNLPGIVLLLLASRVVVAIAYLFLCVRILPSLKAHFRFDRRALPRLLTFGGWVTVGNVTNAVLLSMDRFLIGALLSVAAVGFYTAPLEAVTKLWIIPASLATTIFPACSALGVGRKQELGLLYSRSIKYLLVALGPIAVVLFAFSREVLQVWLGAGFVAKSTLVLEILAVGVFFNCFAHVPYSFLHGLGRPDSAAKLFLCELPVYSALAWWMIRRWGISGAAAAWSIRVAVEVTLLLVIGWRLFSLSPHALKDRGMIRGIAALAVLAVVMTATRITLVGSFLAQASLGAVWLVLFALAAWGYVFDDTDRSSVLAMMGPVTLALRRRSEA